MAGEELIRIWLNVADRAEAEGYRNVNGIAALPARVRGDSSLWSERFLSRDSDPQYQKTGVQIGVHLSTADSPDLLRYDYRLDSRRLSIVESNNFMLIRIAEPPAPLNSSQSTLREYVEAAAASILNIRDGDHVWRFQFPDQIREGTIFSTQQTTDPLFLPQWTERADGGIHNRVLYFLCYKKVLQNAGYDDIKNWFDPEFRRQFR